MMRRIAATVAVATVVTTVAMAGGTPAFAAHRASTTGTTSYYLSLGDSLAQGVMPNSSGTDEETNLGYANQLYDSLRLGNPTLKLVKLGCPGETTATMINGGICTYAKGSQLAQAASFLAHHKGQVQLVTIDIGANDLNPCLVLTSIPAIVKCLEGVFPTIQANLTTIMNTLTTADGSGPVPTIIGMKYYDPELASWLEGTEAGRTLAKDSIALAEGFGTLLGGVYSAFGAEVADVFTAFHTTAFHTHVTLPAFGVVPKDVGYICMYTWECAAPPVGPNEHATVLGYGVIANTFLDTYLG